MDTEVVVHNHAIETIVPGRSLTFVFGALLAREVAVLDHAVDGVLTYAPQGSGRLVLLVAVVNGIAEGLLFRGALRRRAGSRRRPGDHRRLHDHLDGVGQPDVRPFRPPPRHPRRDGAPRVGRRARPILSHVTWSISMLLVLRDLFG